MFLEKGSVSLGDVVPIGALLNAKELFSKSPLRAAGLSQSKSGRTSALRLPQAVAVMMSLGAHGINKKAALRRPLRTHGP